MTKEDKELLLKDLCARLPYGLKYNFGGNDGCDYTMDRISLIAVDDAFPIEDCKPYLFPLSSMTEGQKKYISDRWGINEDFDFEIDPNWGKYFVDLGDAVGFIEWLNENHFDYHYLIPKGLSIDATGLNIY